MRRILGGFLTLCFVLGVVAASGAQEKPDGLAVVNKAVKAGGGEEKLAKLKAHTWKEKGTYYGMGAGLPYTGKYAVQWPDQFRMEIEGVFTLVVNGDKGWMKNEGGEAVDMDKEQLAMHKEGHHVGYVGTLLPLKDKAFTLTTLGEEKVDNKPAIAVKVTHKGRPDVTLFFDKESGLLVKSAAKVKSGEQGGKEVTQEVTYADHKDMDGCKIPMKITIKHDGKLYVEAETLEVKAAGKLEASVFAKP